jgi:hypothetical protein
LGKDHISKAHNIQSSISIWGLSSGDDCNHQNESVNVNH